jgi:hypothetical protein
MWLFQSDFEKLNRNITQKKNMAEQINHIKTIFRLNRQV